MGIAWPEPSPADLAHCAASIRVHSKSFSAAARLLPAHARARAIATYAFCRAADDDVDGASEEAAEVRHRRTRERLRRIYSGESLDTPAARAFAWVVYSSRIPEDEPVALLDGMEQDLGVVRIERIEELLGYAYRAAGVVGRMMARIMGRTDPVSIRRATELGMAMQLTNISRDLREDAERNRIYLPGDWLLEEGGTFEHVFSKPFGPAVPKANARLLRLADAYYEQGIAGISRLPRACRPAILASALLYREIGSEVARAGFASEERVAVPRARKMGILARSVARGLLSTDLQLQPTDRRAFS